MSYCFLILARVVLRGTKGLNVILFCVVLSIFGSGIITFSLLVELMRSNPSRGESCTDDGDIAMLLDDDENPLNLAEVFFLVLEFELSSCVLSRRSVTIRVCRLGPRQGETGIVTALFDTFGIPSCPAFHL